MKHTPHHHRYAVWLPGSLAGGVLFWLSVAMWPQAPQELAALPLPPTPPVSVRVPPLLRPKAAKKSAPVKRVATKASAARTKPLRRLSRKARRRLQKLRRQRRRQRVRACLQQLALSGVKFRKRRNPRARPWGRWGRRWLRCSRCQRCSVVGAVRLYPPIAGVDWVNGYRERVPLFLRCELALALIRWSRHLRSQGITRVMHFGTYNCKTMRKDKGFARKISQHGMGRAVDVAAFWDGDGVLYSLVKHWDHRARWRNAKGVSGCWSTRFRSFKARRLYKIACDMWRRGFFSLILTPNFNRVHDDHFHMEAGHPAPMGPGFTGELDGRRWPKAGE